MDLVEEQYGVTQLFEGIERVNRYRPVTTPVDASRSHLSIGLSSELVDTFGRKGRLAVTQPTDHEFDATSNALIHRDQLQLF
jgi:hypothetical protein